MNTNHFSQIQNHKDLAIFIEYLCQDIVNNPDNWENQDLLSFLRAMAGWVSDMDGYYRNMNEPMPTSEVWATIATILQASTIYE